MSDALLASLRTLGQHSDLAALQRCVATLIKMLTNINDQPFQPKFRTLRTTNPAFATAVWNVPGAKDVLLAAGFVIESDRGGDCVVLEESASLARVKECIVALKEFETELSKRGSSSAVNSMAPSSSSNPASSSSTASSSSSMSAADTPSTSSGDAPPFSYKDIYDEIRREKRQRDKWDDLWQSSQNTPEQLEETYNLLTTILQNILSHPTETKYRRLKQTNPKISAFILDRPGGQAFLLHAGFEPLKDAGGGEFLVFPETGDLAALQRAFDVLTLQKELNAQLLEAKRKEEAERNRQALLNIKNMMKKELLARMNPTGGGVGGGNGNVGAVVVLPSSGSSSSSSSSCAAGLATDMKAAKQRELLRKFMGHSAVASGGAADSDAELQRTALLLISDIAVMMETEMRLTGRSDDCLKATWNLEKQRLFDKFKQDKDIAYLHEIKEEWESKLTCAKRKAGMPN